MRVEPISFSKKLVICIALSMGGLLIVQMVLSVKSLFETVRRISRLSISDTQLRYTKQYIESEISKVSLINFPDHLDEYVMYDLSAKNALLEMHQWLHAHEYPIPLFTDKFQETLSRDSQGPKVCVAITTANRPHAPFSYLIQTLSALLNRMNYAKYKDEVYIHVFNVDEGEHEEVKVASQFVPVTNLKVTESIRKKLPRKYQENLDNADVLRRMHSLNCQYPLFIEDDALAKENWMDSVMLAIRQTEQYQFEGKAIAPILANPWLMVKLYCAREESPHLAPKEGVNTGYFQRWNTVAMMFNQEYVLNVSNHLEGVVQNAITREKFDLPIAKDEDIDNWRRKTGLTGMCFEPVIFQHTGVFSSVVDRFPDRNSVNLWYMKSKFFKSEKKPVLFNESDWVPLLVDKEDPIFVFKKIELMTGVRWGVQSELANGIGN